MGTKVQILVLLKQTVKEYRKSFWVRFAPYIADPSESGSLYSVVFLSCRYFVNGLILFYLSELF